MDRAQNSQNKFRLISIGLLCLGLFLPGLAVAEPGESIVKAPAQPTCSISFARLVSGEKNLTDLYTNYRRYVPVAGTENRSFIAFAQKDPRGYIFFDVENAVLKELNDRVIRDKDQVTALTNRYKAIMLMYVKSNAVLRERIVEKYSDFKSVRIAFKRNGSPEENAGLEEHLRMAYDMATRQFSRELDKAGLEFKGRGLAGNTNTWHIAGFASSADEANTAARFARSTTPNADGIISAQKFSDIEPLITAEFAKNEARRKYLVWEFHEYENFFVPNPRNPKDFLPSPALIKTFKDIKPERPGLSGYIRAAKEEVKRVWKLDLSTKQVLALRDYFNFTDKISASLMLPERVILDLNLTKDGVVSVDFAGQGVRNAFQTMVMLADPHTKNAAQAIRAARSAERVATANLDARKAKIADALSKIRAEAKTEMGFSGDDGIFLPINELSREEKLKFISHISQTDSDLAAYRITFQPQNYADTGAAIPNHLRSSLIVKAEEFEKALRSALAAEIPPPELEKFILAIDFLPSEKGINSLEVFSAGLDKNQKEILERLSKKVAQNKDLRLISIRPK